MKSRFAVVVACAAVVFGMLGVPSAGAATSSVARNQSHGYTHNHSISVSGRTNGDITYWCTFEADEPIWLTHESSKLYSVGKIDECSSPAPTTCHMIVELQELKERGGIEQWETMASKDKGWVSCSTKWPGNSSTAGYKCLSTLNDYPFRTVVTLAIEFPGGSGSGDPAVSDSVLKACE